MLVEFFPLFYGNFSFPYYHYYKFIIYYFMAFPFFAPVLGIYAELLIFPGIPSTGTLDVSSPKVHFARKNQELFSAN